MSVVLLLLPLVLAGKRKCIPIFFSFRAIIVLG